jgi:glycerophosphoryl diester phosphodiesterase
MTLNHTPLKIAHRGGTGLWPENTIEAFAKAIDLGAEGIELDVHLTRDKVLVVHHDETLKPAIARDSSGKWIEDPSIQIKDLTFEELQAYDVGRLQKETKYGSRYPQQSPIDGAKIPSLSAVIELLKSRAKPDFRLYLELKTAPLEPETGADPIELARAAADCIEAHSFWSQVTFVSFDWKALQTVKEVYPQSKSRYTTFPFAWIDPDHELAVLDKAGSVSKRLRALSKEGSTWAAGIDWRTQPGDSFAEKTLHSIKAAGGDGWFGYFIDVTEELMVVAKQLGLQVSVWTVDETEDMRKMAELGVEAILTDRPDRLNDLY